ncbi:MAG TPA: alkaline phosphatase D family protein, partial [Gammaproteobacteria bacterium]|nr:alkaline phosphatase D family protein [Gammaproteobacteria bacterium]
MEIEAGPILSFREQKKKASKHFWEVSILVVVALAFKELFKIEGLDAKKKVLYTDANSCFLRFDLSIEQGKTEKSVNYQIHNHTYAFTVPGTATSLHFGFASCNGFSDLSLMKDIKNRSIMWERLQETHENKKYHILILGGDQVYADTVWSDVPSVREWKNLPLERRRLESTNAAMEAELDNYYAKLYKRIWGYAPVQQTLASIPTLMMWDDHEIFDGFGSYPDADQNCPVYQKIYEIARKYFLLFQQHISPDETEKRPGMLCSFSNISLGFKVNQYLILLLDLRSQRTQKGIITHENWNAIFAWNETIKSGQYFHLLLVTSIPIVYPNFVFL